MPTGETRITVEARVLGQRKPLIANWELSLAVPPATPSPDSGPLRLRDLLAWVVRQEVQAFQQRQQERQLIRVLSPDRLQQAALTGKIAMGGTAAPAAEVDEDAAVATALQAFTDGLYFVFLDGQQQQDLDAAVLLRPESTLTFIRLVALAGG